MRVGYFGLGSNVGDRLANLRAAVSALAGEASIDLTAVSDVYETEPVGEVLDQPDFLNAAVAIRTAANPLDLLSICKEIEARMGRAADAKRHSPRQIDIDILHLEGHRGTFGPDRVYRRKLVLPHPEALTRRFVMIPLVDIDPDLRICGEAVAERLASVAGERLRLVARTGTWIDGVPDPQQFASCS